MNTPDQLPPADELAQTRDAIATLKERERELRLLILADPSARTGNAYLAEVVTVTQQRVDLKELRALYPDIVDGQTFPHEIQNVVLRAITEDGEIVARPKRRA